MNDLHPELTAELKALEETLMDHKVRANPDRVAPLLAPEFVEFGASGTVLDRAAAVAVLAAEGTPLTRRMRQFRLRALGPDMALTTCRVTRSDGRETLRSSVWQKRDGRWLMVFHQGTEAAGADEGTS
ncbi:nuclear transport factor 2 family protein [Ideonella sp. DXS22W]|uniref:Nuclear transport factor 2 family protein n=1 Tax=Pseudaquabacterium inlustre TaxID=2984192 RepID=A0ABU9CQX1_9BURK